jgi:hypothetical protein
MPQDAEAEASDNCVLYWLSTRLDIQTVNLATASLPTPALLFFFSLTAKYFLL